MNIKNIKVLALAGVLSLTAVGVDCALLEAAKNGAYPQVILGGDGSSGASVLVNTGG